MIGIYDVLRWLKNTEVYNTKFERGYCGKLDNKPQKALGVYPLKHSESPYRAYEGLESYERVGVSLLIHYTRNAEESQYAAAKLFEFLRAPYLPDYAASITNSHLDAVFAGESLTPGESLKPDVDSVVTRRIIMIRPLVGEPVFVGTDDEGVYEFVIEFEIYTEKESEN